MKEVFNFKKDLYITGGALNNRVQLKNRYTLPPVKKKLCHVKNEKNPKNKKTQPPPTHLSKLNKTLFSEISTCFDSKCNES